MNKIWILTVNTLVPIAFCIAMPLLDISPAVQAQESSESALWNSNEQTEFIQQQIRDLSNPSYRTRQLARWRLEQTPLATIAGIQNCLTKVEFNTATQLVDLLSSLATHGDVTISRKSQDALRANANRVSSTGRLADNALRAIADLQEEKALQILTHHGARIGMPGMLGFNLNAKLLQDERDLALWINPNFSGDKQVVEWIPFLKSVDTIFLEGPGIQSHHFQAVAQLPYIKNVKLKNLTLNKGDLELIKNFSNLELLELSYIDVSDDILSTLAELPVSQSLRLYGTKVSRAGAEQLAKQLDGIDIYCGAGGYLGVATEQSNTTVTKVIHGSGAWLGGIQELDELLSIDGVTIKNFADLRGELGNHIVGDKIVIALRRPITNSESQFLELEVTLGADPN